MEGGLVLLLRRGRDGSLERDVVRLMSLFASEEKTFNCFERIYQLHFIHLTMKERVTYH